MNEYDDFIEVKENFEIEVCPMCREPLHVYVHVDEWWTEYLVCEKCKYAKDVSR